MSDDSILDESEQPRQAADSDRLHRFSFKDIPVRGQWVRLTETVRAANSVHSYPPPIAHLLSQMFAAVSMFADNLKFSGAVALQSQGSGPLIRSLAECREQKYLRGIAHLQPDYAPPANPQDLSAWLGEGRLAISLIPPPDSQQTPYQGMVELQDADLGRNLETYFANSEQLPSRLFLASTATSVTGLLLQRMPSADHASEMTIEAEEEAWRSIVTLADTVTDTEITELPVEQLLGRLFAEYPCRLHPARELSYRCTCSREKSDRTLRVLGNDEIEELLAERGSILIDCELCGTRYSYDAVDIGALLSGNPGPSGSPLH